MDGSAKSKQRTRYCVLRNWGSKCPKTASWLLWNRLACSLRHISCEKKNANGSQVSPRTDAAMYCKLLLRLLNKALISDCIDVRAGMDGGWPHALASTAAVQVGGRPCSGGHPEPPSDTASGQLLGRSTISTTRALPNVPAVNQWHCQAFSLSRMTGFCCCCFLLLLLLDAHVLGIVVAAFCRY